MRKTFELLKKKSRSSEASSSSRSSVTTLTSAQDSSNGPNSSRAILSTTLNAAESSIRLVKEFSDSVPFLGAAASSVVFVIEECKRYSRNSKAFEDLLNPLERMNALLAPYKNSQSALPPRIMGQVEEFDRTISEIRQEVERLKSSGRISRFINSRDNEGRIADVIQRVKAAVEEIMLANLLDVSSGVKEISRGVQEIALAQSLLALNPVHSARYNCVDRDQCLGGTRVSVLDDIHSWFSSGEEQVYWLNGAAGTGKTTIALSVAHQLVSSNKMLIASFFCSRESIDCRTSGLIFPTLACQLASWNREYQNELVDTLNRYPYIGAALPEEQIQRLIVDPLQKVKPSAPVALIIDALDECDGERASEKVLLALLVHIRAAPSLKVFVSCRPAGYVEARLLSAKEHRRMFKLHHVPTNIVDSDLRLFYNHRLQEIRSEKSLVSVDWPSAELVEKLVQHAAGLFIFAVTVCKYVASPGDAQSRLEYLANLSMTEYQDSLSVDMLYTQVLSAAIERIPDGRARRDFARVLASVMLVQEPLNVDTLGHLLGIDSSVVCDLLRDIHPILSAPRDAATGEGELIHTYHASFPDYMTSRDRVGRKVPLAFIPPSEQHFELALRCLQCMNRDLKRILPHSKRFYSNFEIKDLKVYVENNISSTLRYACLYWADHLAAVPVSSLKDSPILNELYLFASTKLLFWLECLSLLRASEAVIATLVKGEACLMRLNDNERKPTLQLFRDAYQAAKEFFPIVKNFAVHLYLSFILFLPRDSLLLQHYSHQLHASYKITGHLRRTWNPLLRSLRTSPCNNISFSPDGRSIGYVTYTITSFSILHGDGSHQRLSPSIALSEAQQLDQSKWDPVNIPGVDAPFPPFYYENLQPCMNAVVWLSTGDIVTACTVLSAAPEPFECHCYVSVWDPETSAHKRLLLHTSEPTNYFLPTLAVSPKHRFVGISTPSSLVFWDTKMWKQCTVCPTPTEYYRCFSMSDSHYLIGTELRKIETTELRQTLPIDPQEVASCQFSHDGEMIVLGLTNGVVQVWNPYTGRVAFSHSPTTIGLRYSDNIPPPAVAFSPDGKLVVFSSVDYVHLLSVGDQSLVSSFSARNSCYVTFSPDGVYVASLDSYGRVYVWSVPVGGDTINEMLGPPAPQSVDSARTRASTYQAVAFMTDNRHCVSGDTDGQLCVWDCDYGTHITSWQAHSSSIRALAISPDASFLASSDHHTTMIWSSSCLNDNEEIRPHFSIPMPPDAQNYIPSLSGLTFSRDSTKLVILNGYILEILEFAPGAGWHKSTEVRMPLTFVPREVMYQPDNHTFNPSDALAPIGFNYDWLAHCYHGISNDPPPFSNIHHRDYELALRTHYRSPFRWWKYSKVAEDSFTHFQLYFSHDQKSILAPTGIYDIATGQELESHAHSFYPWTRSTEPRAGDRSHELFWKERGEVFKRSGVMETFHPQESAAGWVLDAKGRRCFWIPEGHYGEQWPWIQWYYCTSYGDRFAFISEDRGQSDGLIFVRVEGASDVDEE